MFIVLPYVKSGLDKLIDNFDFDILRRSIHLMNEVVVELVLPKFKFEFKGSYLQILKEVRNV